jgi:hypothetical protein
MKIMKNSTALMLGLMAWTSAADTHSTSAFLKHGRHHSQTPPLEDSLLIPQIHPVGFLEDHASRSEADSMLAEPEGGTSPFITGKVDDTVWSATSHLPRVVQLFFAGLWILMLAALPFIIPVVSQKPVTKTQAIVGAVMLVVLFGGFYLFTNIILFQSVHFKTIRPLTMVECIYFMAQVITTVGYGDVTPAKIRGQVFVGLYVLGALFVIAMLISDLTEHMVQKAKEYREHRMREASGGAGERGEPKTLASLIAPEKPSMAKLLSSLALFAVLDLCWIMFFYLHPNEGKTLFQAVYMSVITLSTVGFGWFTPVTETGMIFGAFWMLFGSGALVSVISNFTELMVKMNEYELANPTDQKVEAMEHLKKVAKGGQDVTFLQFLKFSLVEMKRVSPEEIDHVMEAFEQLKPVNGKVGIKAVSDSLDHTEEPASEEAKTK